MWLIVAIMVWKYHAWIIFGATCYLWYKVWQHADLGGRWRVRRRMKQLERQALLRRADEQMRDWNEAGIYEGQYPGVTMPLAQPQATPMYSDTSWYDYHDDGLTDWRTA